MATARTAEPAATPQGIVWEATSTPDLLSNFVQNDSTTEGGDPPVVVPSPDLPGRQAIQFTVPSGGKRSELLPKVPEFQNGTTMFFGYNGVLADDFPVDADAFQIIMQWHQAGDEGSPPVALHVRQGQIILSGGDNQEHANYDVPVGPARPGQQLNLVVRIAFSDNPQQGSLDVWSGGQHVVTDYHPESGTAYDQYNYLKVGMYRDPSLDGTARVTMNNVVVGTDLASVERELGAPPSSEAQNGDPSAQSTSTSAGQRTTSFSASSFALGVAAVVAIALVIVVVRRSRTRGRP
jgi:hypothetical protein